MSLVTSGRNRRAAAPTWEQFKAAVRRHDRDTLLTFTARLNAMISNGTIGDEPSRYGLNPWNLANVARTALAWSRFQRPAPSEEEIRLLCLMDANISDEEDPAITNEDRLERIGRLLTRIFFEQFPGQQSMWIEIARSILLFGSASEDIPGFEPEAMSTGWFEAITGGISLDDYVGAIFLIYVMAQQNQGQFSPGWLDSPQLAEIAEAIRPDLARRVFDDFLVTTPEEFKAANRRQEESLPPPLKRYAFNPLQDTPFIQGVSSAPIAPWLQAVPMKAFSPSIYFMGLRRYGVAFSRDLGKIFQHYAGRQLMQISGGATVYPEVSYGPNRRRIDSTDWFLDLPELLVLIECKARQPVESLRTGSPEWMGSIDDSIAKGIRQLNKSNTDIDAIAEVNGALNVSKPRVGLVVTLEPFYVNNNWLLQERLPVSNFPVGVISASELEWLVCSDAVSISNLLATAQRREENQLLRLDLRSAIPGDAENSLLAETWDSIALFRKVEALGSNQEGGAPQ